MLQINDLSIRLREDDRVILQDLSFTLNIGDRIGLIGEEGNGKSLLLETIVDRSNVERYCKVDGDINKKGEIIGYLPQHLKKDIADIDTEEYLYKSTKEFLDYNMLYEYLNRFKLSDDIIQKGMKLKYLSGGERTKFLLIVELLKSPTLFLFDEPSNDLDLDSLRMLEDMMLELEIPFIFVSHETRLLRKVSNKIIHIEQIHRRTEPKCTVSKNTYDEYVNKRMNYIVNETRRANKEKEEFDKKVDRYKRVHDSVQYALRITRTCQEGRNLKDKMHTVKSIGRRLEKEKERLTKAPDYEEAIELYFDREVSVPNNKTILDIKLDRLKAGDKILSRDIELKVLGPKKICIVGKNGIGKTTLLKYIVEELKKSKLNFLYMPQSYRDYLGDDLTAIDYLKVDNSPDEHERISTFLGGLKFKREEMFRKVSKLSGGQKAKLFFAKMNLLGAEALIMDEPTRNLSPLSKPELIDSLISYGGAVIAVSHDRDFIDEVFDEIYELTPDGLIRVR